VRLYPLQLDRRSEGCRTVVRGHFLDSGGFDYLRHAYSPETALNQRLIPQTRLEFHLNGLVLSPIDFGDDHGLTATLGFQLRLIDMGKRVVDGFVKL
jgi:hypothetical protein